MDEQLCFALYAATHAITRIYRPMLAEFNITYPQYIVLLVLLERAESTVNGIADALKLDAATVTPLLKRLAEAGWITRERNRADERVVVVRLTPQGRSLEAQLAEVQNTVRCRTGLDINAFRNLRDTLDQLTETLAIGSGQAP
ncbi:MarR family winged helix-turn-helix transcriptional regulator [Acidiphilium angustum]|uniref:MarR family winged helix-turn-helix transcriptional regulator n=1 Tax=Acidiphilium angustum TaxID=523 RepID=UPI001FE16A71|nr:MarR family transcriptional regulator [Acidiphilium angustum]